MNATTRAQQADDVLRGCGAVRGHEWPVLGFGEWEPCDGCGGVFLIVPVTGYVDGTASWGVRCADCGQDPWPALSVGE